MMLVSRTTRIMQGALRPRLTARLACGGGLRVDFVHGQAVASIGAGVHPRVLEPGGRLHGVLRGRGLQGGDKDRRPVSGRCSETRKA